MTQLGYVAQALNKGDLALARISLVRAELPPLPNSHLAREMAQADGLLIKYNPDWEDESRLPAGDPDGGQWTGGGEDDSRTDTSGLQPAADRVDPTQAKKERFVDSHLADAQKVADQLGVPVENILAASALESGWGEHPFAAQGNNYFGIHYPAPFATGYMVAASGVKVATFSSYADSLKSFVAIAGSKVTGIVDPYQFGAALHATGKFGVGNPTYGNDVANTIRGLRAIVARHGA
jgi:Mannosyl-glycoprotein endo-beta-N-acetylglucosaminidase